MDLESVATNIHRPAALTLLSSEPRRATSAGGRRRDCCSGDWGTSRLYVLGLALFFAGRTSFWPIVMMSGLILAVGWAYTQICRIYPDGGGHARAEITLIATGIAEWQANVCDEKDRTV